MKTEKGNIWVFDNGGKTFDRYTIIDSDTNVYGASVSPFHPQGFGQYCFTQTDSLERVCQSMGKKLTKGMINGCLNELLTEYRKKDSNIGKEIKKFDSLPGGVKKYILEHILG